MKDYDTLYRSIKHPVKPKLVKPERSQYINNTEWGRALDECEARHAEELAAYDSAVKEYHNQHGRLETQFWEDLYDELGWDRLPQPVSIQLQSLAYDRGHSAGYNEVRTCACDYAELVDAIVQAIDSAKHS